MPTPPSHRPITVAYQSRRDFLQSAGTVTASASPLYGLSMIEELARHGYRLSAGTLYPILHGLEKKG
jgi:DNA-binding PadR family transcriptional regulator